MPPRFYGYIRVSTMKQGEGVSLEAQRDAIARYAGRHGLMLAEWFEEKETAAKRGRPVFTRMLRLLRRGAARGVVIHKIDRSARNLKDWADLGELIDLGVEVHFANESLDLHSRGGRLSADIQAVVAADYVRNLREETRKGFYGRLKQGLYPLPAPLGYLDTGKGKAKSVDPDKGSLVRLAFDLYASGRHTLKTLQATMHREGLRNRRGGAVTLNGWSVLLNNPFYIGLIRLRRTRETFAGAHAPLVRKSLFDRVQDILNGRVPTRSAVHEFTFRRLFRCAGCGYSLIGEARKGHVYYRCHSPACAGTCLREERLDEAVVAALEPLRFTASELTVLKDGADKLRSEEASAREKALAAVELQRGRLRERLGRLTDAYIDRMVDRELFEARKAALLHEERQLAERRAALEAEGGSGERLTRFLELLGSAFSLYKSGLPAEKRELLQLATSNRMVERKNVVVMLREPFSLVREYREGVNGGPHRDRPRTFVSFLEKLHAWFVANPSGLESILAFHSAHHSKAESQNKAMERAA